MKKRYGFFGGCFNPVTNAHINLANLAVEKFNLDKLVFVPMGDKYQKQDLANEEHRYKMLKIATLNQEKLEVSDLELNLPHALTTLQAFQKIEEQYQDITSYFMIGADNLNKLTNSRDFEILAKNYEYIILERQGIQIKELIAENPILKRFENQFHILENNPYEKVSSTEVRNSLKNSEEQNLHTMISKEVYGYIKENQIYKNENKHKS
ncbi:MAG: nicotinate (nicotinamide) nucleotide adenylyltransferase [Clostridia bacterium]|nr:nicotinate (nicotinamide) nucleotide adenylyltransferase [Clostridia bacterium]